MNKNFLFRIYTAVIILLIALAGCSSGTSGSGSAPSGPDFPTAISAVSGDRQVRLTWNAVPLAGSYKIYFSSSPGLTIASGTMVAQPSTTAYLHTGLTNSTTYYYIVTAVSASGESRPSPEVSATPGAVGATVELKGKMEYEDKEYGASGFTGIILKKSVRYATVELVSGNNVVSTATTSTGSYTIQTTPTNSSAYIRVNSTAAPGGASQIYVKNMSGSIYSYAGSNFILSGPADINLIVPALSIGGAFNILDVFTSGFEFVNSLNMSYPPLLTAFWQPGNQNGTYYCDGVGCGQEGIYILNDPSSGDSDEYDDDVLWHEFGHFVAAHFSKDDSPGGYHRLTDNDLDMRLTWSEGWGDFLPGAIKYWLSSTNPALLSTASGLPLSLYVDNGMNSLLFAFDFGNPNYPPYNSYFNYSTSEVAVAKVLWDTMNASFGSPRGMSSIWSAITSTNFKSTLPHVNIESFWDEWLVQNSGDEAALRAIFAGRLIDYFDDAVSNDTFETAEIISVETGSSKTRNLYPAGDGDIFSFNTDTNQSYTVATSSLKNGADTFITLYNLVQAQTATNDNWIPYTTTAYSSWTVPSDIPALYSLCETIYGPCHENRNDVLTSKITFTAPDAGKHYVKVNSSSSPPVSAGRYGKYTLTITSP